METTNWTASQGEALMDPAEDKALISYMSHFDSVKTFEESLKSHNIINIKKMSGRRQYYLARALVTVKANVDRDPIYPALNHTTSEAYSRAWNLFKEADVPLNTYSLQEVQKIQDYLGRQGYQIKVFQAHWSILVSRSQV